MIEAIKQPIPFVTVLGYVAAPNLRHRTLPDMVLIIVGALV